MDRSNAGFGDISPRLAWALILIVPTVLFANFYTSGATIMWKWIAAGTGAFVGVFSIAFWFDTVQSDDGSIRVNALFSLLLLLGFVLVDTIVRGDTADNLFAGFVIGIPIAFVVRRLAGDIFDI